MSVVVASPVESRILPQQPHSSSITTLFRNFFTPQTHSEDELRQKIKQQLDIARFAIANDDFVLAREIIKALIPLVKKSKTLSSFALSWKEMIENLEVHAVEMMQAQIAGVEEGSSLEQRG